METNAASCTRVAVVVGCGSKHDKGGGLDEFEPTVRFGLGGALSIKFAQHFDHVLILSRYAHRLYNRPGLLVQSAGSVV